MIVVAAIEVLRKEKRTQYLEDLELAAVPAVNDRVVINIDGTGYIFNVLEIHYGGRAMVDIFIERLGSISDYNERRFR